MVIWVSLSLLFCENMIATGCFNVEYQEANPISDVEGSKLLPYTFYDNKYLCYVSEVSSKLRSFKYINSFKL